MQEGVHKCGRQRHKLCLQYPCLYVKSKCLIKAIDTMTGGNRICTETATVIILFSKNTRNKKSVECLSHMNHIHCMVSFHMSANSSTKLTRTGGRRKPAVWYLVICMVYVIMQHGNWPHRSGRYTTIMYGLGGGVCFQTGPVMPGILHKFSCQSFLRKNALLWMNY